jgi:hypothetical protein
MDLVAHAIKTNSCGSYYAHMPNASNEDRVLPRGTLVGKAQDLNEWLPLDAASATEITKPFQERQFQWCRMAQGLAGSPGYFSLLKDLIMAGAENVLTYIDDLLVHSKNH